MSVRISAALLEQFSDFVASHFGLNIPQNRYSDLERNLLGACHEFGFNNVNECLHWLYASPLTQEQTEVLTSRLTVGETYFFREKPLFELLENRILPEIIASRRNVKRLRIWSAGCATGEEAYSLAILVSKLLPELNDWNLTIIGTDINVRSLSKAATGTYSDWSFRNTPPWLKLNYMQKTADGRYQVLRHIRECVTFSYHNLVKDPYPAVENNTNAMDIILCCNVLMYFQAETIRQIARKFHRSLVKGGWLIVSPGEATPALYPDFERVAFPSAVMFRQQGESARGALPAVAPASFFPEPEAEAEMEELPWGQGVIPAYAPPDAGTCDKLETIIPSPPPSIDEAHTLYACGLYTEAAEILQTMDSPQAMALKARVYANQGQLAQALSWCDQAVVAAKLDPRLHYLRASILLELGREEEALESLKHTLYLEQDFVLAHMALGNLLERQGKHNEAQRQLRIALSLLQDRPRDETFPDSEGMTAGRLLEVVIAAQQEARYE